MTIDSFHTMIVFLGLDAAFQQKQGVWHVPYVEELLSFATGKDKEGRTLLTLSDMSKILGKRRSECRANNKEFSLSFFHKMFGSGK